MANGRWQEDLKNIQMIYQNKESQDIRDFEAGFVEAIYEEKDYEKSIYLCSYLLTSTHDIQWLHHILCILVDLSEDKMSWRIRNQLYGQISCIMFKNTEYRTEENQSLLARIYRGITVDMKKEFHLQPEFVAAQERNKNLVLVQTGQFLDITHGPTKTALDRCATLMRKLGKQVMLINTAEIRAENLQMPWFEIIRANYIADYMQYDQVEYEGLSIPFFQCDNNMPDRDTMLEIVQLVRRLKPVYMIGIGGSSLLMELCSDYVPTITISTVPSELAMTMGQIQVLGRKVNEMDKKILQSLGQSTNQVIEGRFTSSIPVKKTPIAREQMGFSKDEFICVVVGGRLEREITDDFVKMMMSIPYADIKFVFLGLVGKTYQFYADSMKGFEDKVIALGPVTNILGYLEQCDLYVNPRRAGDGTSVIEAMHEGLPAVTINYGDVALGAGEEFCVSDYEEMAQQIVKYYKDKQYYEEMSQKAKRRAGIMLDTDTAFCEILNEAEQRLEIK